MHEAISLLKQNDPVLARAIESAGEFALETKTNHFESLCQAIVFQQLSMKAASTIYKRFKGLQNGKITPKKTLALRKNAMRKAGLSERKAEYIHDLASKFVDRIINPKSFPSMSDSEIISALTKVRGIGEWTAHMFLIFSLGRLDVLPTKDLGFQNALMRLYGLKEKPSEEKIVGIAEKWAPYRTVAVWYLWKSADKGVEY